MKDFSSLYLKKRQKTSPHLCQNGGIPATITSMKTIERIYYFRSQNTKIKTIIQWIEKGLLALAFLPLIFFFLISVLSYGLIRPFLDQNSRNTLRWHFDHIDRFLPSTLNLKKDQFALVKELKGPYIPGETKVFEKAVRLEGEGFYLLRPKQRTVWQGTEDEWEHFDPMAA